VIKVGRYTAALLIISVGVSVLFEQTLHGDYLSWLFDWWAIFLIVLGCEYLLYVYRYKDRPMKLDGAGLLVSALLSVLIVGGLKVPLVVDALRTGDFAKLQQVLYYSAPKSSTVYSKDVIVVPVVGVSKIELRTGDGDIEVRGGSGDEIEIHAAVEVVGVSKERGQAIADRSRLIHKLSGDVLNVSTEPEAYETDKGKRQNPSMHLIVYVPVEHKAAYELDSSNGSVVLSTLTAPGNSFSITLDNGELNMDDIGGQVEARLKNGAIRGMQMQGDVTLTTDIGAIDLDSIHGNVQAHTAIGEINLSEISGDVEAVANLGEISIRSRTLGGDWNVVGKVGAVRVELPALASFKLTGRVIGSVQSDFPLSHIGENINGESGGGRHAVRIESIGSFTFGQIVD